MRNSPAGRIGVAAAMAGLALLVPASLAAHDIPPSVAILAYVKPEGHTLRLVVRLPLEAFRDINWPLRGPGYLQLEKLKPLLDEGVTTWISNFVHLYEGQGELSRPVIAATQVSLPSDRSFTTFDGAFAHATGAPLPPATDLAWQQAMLDVVLEYPIASDTS
ncbi:MAG TPA: hypothetical protein VE967_14090, partial [Gemmatimonadaceae bacterium]|nr:hypothetical protein [Gemmatimonadaceae bacterium]